ncbi:MAG: hypothetical protein ACP5H2_04760 [Solirubrobacteraceae bacterium]
MVFVRIVKFRRLETVSAFHSCVYLSLLICAFALGKPEPATFVLGLTHGLIWIGMSLTCIAAVRWRVIPFWLAVAVVVLGGLGPFMGTAGFIYESRRRAGLAVAASDDR